jgi:lipopolysaccharide transport system ATP-binding protein
VISDAIINVENLSKSYLVGHRTGERERYTALRDVLARETRNMVRKAVDLVRGRQIVEGDNVEQFWALKEVSFEVRRGDVVGIIGRNGAGKSTLLKILSRITEPSEGRVTLRGRVASLLEVGTGFHPELTGRENIYLNGSILGMTRIEIRKKFDEIVAFSEVEKFLDTPVKRYSSGMYVRLAFAVAAHLEPEILAVDEVLAVGDAEFQKKCLGKIGEVARSGRTVFFVSHNMNAIERLCGRVLYLENGRLAGAFSDVRQGIVAYLKGSSSQAAGNIWRRSDHRGGGEDYFIPEQFEICNLGSDARGGNPLTNAFPIEIKVSGSIVQTDPALNIGIGLYNDNDELLFWSFTTDERSENWPKLNRGPIKLRMVLPLRLLNEGNYRVELLASLHHRAWLLEPRRNAPNVTFSIQGGLSDSPYWDHKRPGILGPVLRWERIQVEAMART